MHLRLPALLAALLLPAGLYAGEGETPYFAPGIELPEGRGRELALHACTRCHDLRGVPAFKGYWTQAQWLAMIETMVKHGAPLDDNESEQLAAYLAQHFGRVAVPAP